ncbi:MAG: hypothetical protein ACR2O1_17245 [Boseongicola sp.]
MRVFGSLILVLALAVPAWSEVIDTKSARKLVFSTKGQNTQMADTLSDEDRALIVALIPLMEQQMRTPVKYYSSIAYSPDEGLVSDALQGAFNFHTTEAADAAAIAACNKARKRGAKRCQLAARIVPKKYKPRELTLSYDATDAFSRRFRREKAPKSFAISLATGAWGMGKSDAMAIAACEKEASSKADCQIVIRD